MIIYFAGAESHRVVYESTKIMKMNSELWGCLMTYKVLNNKDNRGPKSFKKFIETKPENENKT